jgi:hypothetical protein
LYGIRYERPSVSGSRPSCEAWITAANTLRGSHSASFGVRRNAVSAMRDMRSAFRCFGSARLISGSQAFSMAGKSFGFLRAVPVTAFRSAVLISISLSSVVNLR